VLVLIILILVKPYKKKLVKHKKPREIVLKVNTEKADLKEIESSGRKFNMEYSQIIIQQTDKAGISTVQMRFKRNTLPESSIDILNELGHLEGVYEARYNVE
jgi:short subunit fatty acids transporter